MAPEYGGNDKTSRRRDLCRAGDGLLSSHSPLDLMFYQGKQFPAHYRGGAFVVQHGGNGRA